MLKLGTTVTIYSKQYEVVRAINGCSPCSVCSFAHLEGCVFPCSVCSAPNNGLIPIGCYLKLRGKSYKPGRLVTIGNHVYQIRKAPQGKTICDACRKANGRTICNASDYKPYSCRKYTNYSCYLHLIK